MHKLSHPLKALIHAPFARPGPTPITAPIADVYRKIAHDAVENNVGHQPWVTFSAAATITMNAPDALLELHRVATTEEGAPAVATAELIREVGLKSIGFNGIPRAINVLGAFRAGLPLDVADQLSTTATRMPPTTPEAHEATAARGLALWRSVYAGVDERLLGLLAESHPDLPVHILHSHYGPLFTDPPGHAASGLATVGRALTSLTAIGCLRAQTGVGPQVVSHILGLRKAMADGTWLPPHVEAGHGGDAGDAVSVRGVDWLATDPGTEWMLHSIDDIVSTLGGANFAVGPKETVEKVDEIEKAKL